MKREKQRRKCLKDENCGAGGEPSPPSLGGKEEEGDR